MTVQVHYRYAEISGHQLFYREAGPADGPVVLLLHGFPTSSYMFRDLIPQLAARYRVIAPDMLGFGLSDAPSVEDFHYTFDALAALTSGLLGELGVTRCALYVQDYGAPIGWRLALKYPEAITAIITQNGNGYDEGFVPAFWKTVWDYQAEQNETTEAAIRQALTLDVTRWQYLTGAPDDTLVNPEAWDHDYQLLTRPGNDAIQLALFLDYATNPPMYPELHTYLRDRAVPVLAVWGQDDQIFAPAGAEAFARDAVDAEVHLLDGGHFLLETAALEVADLINDFLARRLPPVPASEADTNTDQAMLLEVVTVPVRDVDQALAFYTDKAGFALDVDYRPDDSFRVVQLTPPGSAASIQLYRDADRAGSLSDALLVVNDLEGAISTLTERGVAVSAPRHKATEGGWRGGFKPDADPDHGDYASFADFQDPDGNSWLLQERNYAPRAGQPDPALVKALCLENVFG
jgi:pimeloyl-ACP methyl ester carboxylesterase/catechol 2,3-dioxygenase-like lactoylglutathione lyase family enzyme